MGVFVAIRVWRAFFVCMGLPASGAGFALSRERERGDAEAAFTENLLRRGEGRTSARGTRTGAFVYLCALRLS